MKETNLTSRASRLAYRTLEQLTGGHRVADCMGALFEGLDGIRSMTNREDWQAICHDIFLPHPLGELLQQDPLTYRARNKPRGYAGDGVMMDMIYQAGRAKEKLQEATPLGKEIHKFILERPTSQGVRGRRRIIARRIEKLGRDCKQAEILSVACGHLREGLLVSAGASARLARMTALDQDSKSLEEAENSLPDWSLEAVQGSIRRLISGRENLGSFDLIYSLGLFDYLEVAPARLLVGALFEMLKPGGRLVVANFLPMKSAAYMEAFMDWHLIYRTPEQLISLADSTSESCTRGLQFLLEPSGTVGLLDLQRSST